MSALTARAAVELAELLAGREPLRFTYQNYRGETRERKVIPLGVRWDVTPHHPEPQWFLDAVDVEKVEAGVHVFSARRTFAFSGFRPGDMERAEVATEFYAAVRALNGKTPFVPLCEALDIVLADWHSAGEDKEPACGC